MSYGLNVEMHKQVRNEIVFFSSFLFLGLVGIFLFYVGCFFFKYNDGIWGESEQIC